MGGNDPPVPVTEERRAELEVLARELAQQVAWDMGLSRRPLSAATVRDLERETLNELLAEE
ncbi:hypothetical protein E3T61_03055 [Cryobacterium lactosi]|uniref:Uncharacterized protein n=1 Tax=Cryobacterium lactosi TaxID=1259202 RepID=A0A4R9BY15_9MICO|nr:hypothetical protein [Cryobacterium lactosi]TFD93993.1 hypothetical protein E3T61_03055 [Cryobacterium lactosi]